MSSTVSIEASYDKVPYISRAFAQTHPEHLRVIARLFGVDAPPSDRCRVLELGCSSGGNLMPMAVAAPESQFVGVDLSSRQVQDGQRVVEALGLRNVDLRHFDITKVDQSFGTFDYIIAHGVYSWIPKEVRDHLMRICKENLAPNGVAYVSYNVYPGWHMRGMIRDMMLYHANRFTDETAQIGQARALLDFLAQNVPTENSPYGLLLRQEAQNMSRHNDWYLMHEYLEGVNEPVYFHDFVQHAGAHGLQYLGESEFHTMLTTNFPPAVTETLQKISGDIIRSEQYMDFLRNRFFRQTLLVHANLPLNRNLHARLMHGFHVTSYATTVEPAVAVDNFEMAKYRSPAGVTFGTQAPIVKAAMNILAERAPEGYDYPELLAKARERAQSAPPVDMGGGTDDELLGTEILKTYAAGMMEFRFAAAPFVPFVSERPKASDLARHCARSGLPVTSQKHINITIDDFNRHVLSLLDGTRDRQALIEALVALVKSGDIVVARRENAQERVTEENEVRTTIAQAVEMNLPQLARHALLVA